MPRAAPLPAGASGCSLVPVASAPLQCGVGQQPADAPPGSAAGPSPREPTMAPSQASDTASLSGSATPRHRHFWIRPGNDGDRAASGRGRPWPIGQHDDHDRCGQGHAGPGEPKGPSPAPCREGCAERPIREPNGDGHRGRQPDHRPGQRKLLPAVGTRGPVGGRLRRVPTRLAVEQPLERGPAGLAAGAGRVGFGDRVEVGHGLLFAGRVGLRGHHAAPPQLGSRSPTAYGAARS